ncbi:MAG: hypothetical protein E6H48_19725 [Betaproteobacteria bacterium]|nr:MAG: hypothetical protein E6H48_19725 [Betaproteobacteria bacterium]
MTQPHPSWKVRPHGELSEIDDGMLSVVGPIRMPIGSFPRRMTVIRLSDSRLVVWSAMALGGTEMAKLEAFGRPAFLIVPNDHHRLDAKAWKDRYPEVQVVAPIGSRAKVEKVVPVDTTAPNFGDPNVQFVTAAGTHDREAALVVRTRNGATLVLNDLVGNIRDASGIGGWLLGLAGFAGRSAQIPKVVKWNLVKDANALRAQLLKWADMQALKRILVSHGEPIDANPQQTLRALAGSLT